MFCFGSISGLHVNKSFVCSGCHLSLAIGQNPLSEAAGNFFLRPSSTAAGRELLVGPGRARWHVTRHADAASNRAISQLGKSQCLNVIVGTEVMNPRARASAVAVLSAFGALLFGLDIGGHSVEAPSALALT